MHEYFEEDIATTKENLGKTYPLFINGEWRETSKQFEKHSPVDKSMLIGKFQEASKADVEAGMPWYPHGLRWKFSFSLFKGTSTRRRPSVSAYFFAKVVFPVPGSPRY